MSSLSLGEIRGLPQYNYEILIPEKHYLNTSGDIEITKNIKIPVWNNNTKPKNPNIGSLGYNEFENILELYNGEEWIAIGRSKADWEKIVTLGLISYLDPGVLSSYSGSGNSISPLVGSINGTLVNGITYSSDNGGVLNFNGVDNYITLSQSTDLSGEFCYCAWVYRSVVSPNGYTNLFTSTLQNEQHQVDTTGFSGSMGMYVNGAYSRTENNVIPINEWVYVCYQRNGTKLNGWVNGIRVYNGENDLGYGSVSTAQSRVNKIGAYSTGTSYNLNGKLSAVQLYNRSLTSAEIWNNFKALAPRFNISTNYNIVDTGLVVRLDAYDPSSYEGSGTTWYDLSGNNNHGTLVNGPTYDTEKGGRIVFDGDNDRVEIPNLSFTPYCIDFWLYNNSAIINNNASIGGPSSYQTLLQFGSQYAVNLGGWSSAAENETLHIWSNNNTRFTFTKDESIPVGYHHFAFNWNGSTYDIYVDGNKLNTYAATGGNALLQSFSNTTIYLASNNSTYEFFGKIMSFKVYGSQLTEDQVRQNFFALREIYGI